MSSRAFFCSSFINFTSRYISRIRNGIMIPCFPLSRNGRVLSRRHILIRGREIAPNRPVPRDIVLEILLGSPSQSLRPRGYRGHKILDFLEGIFDFSNIIFFPPNRKRASLTVPPCRLRKRRSSLGFISDSVTKPRSAARRSEVLFVLTDSFLFLLTFVSVLPLCSEF